MANNSTSIVRRTRLLAACALIACANQCRPASGSYTAAILYGMNVPDGTTIPTAGSFHPTNNGQVVGFATPGPAEGLAWSSVGNATVMNPTNLTGFTGVLLEGVNGSQIAGYGSGPASGATNILSQYHALLWNGSPGSAVDLHPTNLSGFVGSNLFDTDGVHQVGVGTESNGVDHAMLWSGAANTAVDLHNATKFGASFFNSEALGVNGNQQVGFIMGSGGSPYHAVMWSGTAASAVDLNPSGASSSEAYGVGGGQQVGFGLVGGTTNAYLWTGTAASAVDLNPAGLSTAALETNGAFQVGYQNAVVGQDVVPEAMAWSGTAASAVNLHALLQTQGNFIDSKAYSVNAAGDFFGVATENGTGNKDAVIWLASPHTAVAGVSAGTSQVVTAAGRSSASGSVQLVISPLGSGTLTNVNGVFTVGSLGASTTGINFTQPGIDGLVESWNLSLNDGFSGPFSATFHYDPNFLTPGFNPALLRIMAFENGNWVSLPSVTNAGANTIAVTTDQFTVFALGAVPEPATGLILVFGCVGLLRRRR